MKSLKSKRIPLNKGWSHDKKYVVEYQGANALLRVSPVTKKAHRLTMVDAMNSLSYAGVPLCKPLKVDSNEESIKIVFQWIEGEDLGSVIDSYPTTRQYDLGIQAGRYLMKIHTIPKLETQIDWETLFNAKLNRKLDLYTSTPLKYDDDSLYLNAISKYKNLLKNRPTTFQHGDYHIGNMMMSFDNLTIIDFDRWDYGDPWEEFNRIVWSAQVSPIFASGIVDGYFASNVPDEFWKLLLLYISSNMLSSLPWASDFGESEVTTIMNQHNDVVSWYQNHSFIPSWYNKIKTSDS